MIKILDNHNERLQLGELHGNLLTFTPDAKVTKTMLFEIFPGGAFEWLEVEGEASDPNAIVRRVLIHEISLMPSI